jgi:hypothetical protein
MASEQIRPERRCRATLEAVLEQGGDCPLCGEGPDAHRSEETISRFSTPPTASTEGEATFKSMVGDPSPYAGRESVGAPDPPVESGGPWIQCSDCGWNLGVDHMFEAPVPNELRVGDPCRYCGEPLRGVVPAHLLTEARRERDTARAERDEWIADWAALRNDAGTRMQAPEKRVAKAERLLAGCKDSLGKAHRRAEECKALAESVQQEWHATHRLDRRRLEEKRREAEARVRELENEAQVSGDKLAAAEQAFDDVDAWLGEALEALGIETVFEIKDAKARLALIRSEASQLHGFVQAPISGPRLGELGKPWLDGLVERVEKLLTLVEGGED